MRNDKHTCDRYDGINIIKISLRTRHHEIPASRFVVEHIVINALACVKTSRVFQAIVAELIIYDTANVVNLLSYKRSHFLTQGS